MFERLREDIQSVFHRDPAARNAFEVLTCYPGMHAIWIHRLSSALWGMGWKWLARLVSNFGRWLTGIEIHPGAKVLGPFTVGAGAKVGSNAVVTKAVPAGATVVGIPGRIIVKTDDEQDAKRKAMAEKIGFDAYGVGEDMPDPVARAIGQLLDHLQAVDGRLEGMCGALKDLGSNYCAKDLPELREEDFACVKDKDQSQAS